MPNQMSTIDLTFGELIDEASERAGLDPSSLTYRHLSSITRSLQLVFTDIENRGCPAEFRTDTLTVPLPTLYGAVQLPPNTIDVMQVAVLIAGKPYPLGRTSREDYQTLSFPSSRGNPSIYWVTKSAPPESFFVNSTLGADYTPSLDFSDVRNTQNFLQFPAWPVGGPPQQAGTGPYIVIWPQNALTSTQLTVTRARQIAMPSGMGDQIDTSRAWMETIVRGLAAAIALKYNPEMQPSLQAMYEKALMERDADEDHHPVIIAHRAFGFGRARRH